MLPGFVRHVLALPACATLALAPVFALAANPDAVRIQFDNATNGFTATNAQAAIEEAKTSAPGTQARYAIIFAFDGNASTGRWLEQYKSVPSNNSPFVLANATVIRGLSLSCAANATSVVGLYRSGVQIATLTITAARTAFNGGLNISATAGQTLSAKVESGTCSRPVFSVFLQTNV
jgi:hypothetical protein